MKYFLFIILLVFCSCNNLQKAYYGVNKEIIFSGRNDYMQYVRQQTGADTSKVLLLAQPELDILRDEIISKQLSMFYGICFSDKFISATELKVKSCQGEIMLLYKKIPNDLGDINTAGLDNYLASKLSINKSKKTVILLYSYKLGSFFKTKTFNIINNPEKDPDLDYFILSIDQVN